MLRSMCEEEGHEKMAYVDGEGCLCCEYLKQLKILQEHLVEMGNDIDKLESKLFDYENPQECPTKDFY